ncbi:DUF4266 domain-containing protein [Cellulophaga omnivescoria]|uniref:DUF4266 domain-containing protein n=1 Tax=Cellulophaga omnivescoria TaxID=1888890 RepID=UPI000985AC62|nr:DUF4266 domain-containing protein [Cellulophaga omnivescoria]
MRNFILLFGLIITATSCVTVKGYDKVYLNDEEMTLSAKNIERYETNFQVYRESASGANGGKTGGGCGCN